jgi:Phosphate acetyl/butaryl transferase
VIELTDKRALIVGVANNQSIAWGVALALRQAGEKPAITYLNQEAELHVRPLGESVDAPSATQSWHPLGCRDDQPSTSNAAVLLKMAERGQIRGAAVDGPLAMDSAIDVKAARAKVIASLVAGRANVLIVPNLEAGNMLAKELTFVARAEGAGLLLGAKAPVIPTSRADNDRAWLASCALVRLYEYWRREGRAFGDQSMVAKAAE